MTRFTLPALFLTLLTCATLKAAAPEQGLHAGPMVGYSEMREVAVWVQTSTPANVQLAYWPQGKPDQRMISPVAATIHEDNYTATLIAGRLTPGTTYDYEVLINGKAVSLPYETKFETIPDYRDRTPPPDFTVALGGGNYVNDRAFDPQNRIPGEGYNIFLAILAKRPDLMIWLGNNIYLREADWGSRTGIQARYWHNRAQPELQPLLGSVHNVATWSEHDYGAPGADRYQLGQGNATEAFQQHWANPSHNHSEEIGNAFSIRWADAEFFILDDRTFRDLTPLTEARREILGETQLKWLIESLRKSTATFKVIVMGSPMLNPADNPLHFKVAPDERDKFIERITWAEIKGLFFISGGKDFGELTKMVRAGASDAYELTLGPLTGRPASDTDDLNYHRVPSTATFQRQFATLSFHGPEDARELTITVYDVDGVELWSRSFEASSL